MPIPMLPALCIVTLAVHSGASETGGGSPAPEPPTAPPPHELSKDAYNAISELARFGADLRLDVGRPRPGRSDGYGLRLRPVLVTPVPLPDAWKIVPRVRMPTWLVVQDETDRIRAGLSDIDSVVWLATPELGPVQLGLGPAVTWPTASGDAVGDGEWEVGPSAAFVLQPGAFLAHALATYTWTPSSGEQSTDLEVSGWWNSRRGWSVGITTESEIPTANSLRSSVHVGPSIGRVVSTRTTHVQLEVAVLGWVARPDDGPSAAVEFTIQFLLPERK